MDNGAQPLQKVELYESDDESGQWLLVPAGTDPTKLPSLPSSKKWTKRTSFKLDGMSRIATPTDEDIQTAITKQGFCAFKTQIEFIESVSSGPRSS